MGMWFVKKSKNKEREIRPSLGISLERVVDILLDAKARGERVYCNFNGVILHSDTVSLDSAYTEIYGHTKAEHEQEQKEWQENYDREREIAIQKIKERVPEWIERGKSLIFPERYPNWEKFVQDQATNLYNVAALDAALEIMTALENGATVEEAKQIFEKQVHSASSSSMVRRIVFSFSNKGPEFWKATADGWIPFKERRVIKAKKQENMLLAQANTENTENIHKHL